MMLIKQLTDIELLKQCWKEIYFSKPYLIRNRSKGIDGKTLEDFEKDKFKLIPEMISNLTNGIYKFQPLKGIFIEKAKKGKYRLLTVPTVSDRILHKALLKIISPKVYKYTNTGVSYCGIINKSKKSGKAINRKHAIKQLISEVKRNKYYIFESDIKSFFDLVPKQKMYKKIIKMLHPDTSINHLIKQIIFFDIGNLEKIKKDPKYRSILSPNSRTGISQGSSLSPLFSNIYLTNFDLYLKKFCGKGLIRYVDDFIILAKDKKTVSILGKKAEKFMKREGLNLADFGDKTFIKNLRTEQIEFLGLKISRQGIKPKKSLGQLKVKFIDILKFKNYKEVIRNKTTVTKIQQINERIKSWAECYKFYHVNEIYNHLDVLVGSVKRKNSQFSALNTLKSTLIEPLVSIEEWKSFF